MNPCGCRKPVSSGQIPCGRRVVRSGAQRRSGRSWLGRKWDDLRLMGLKLVFLVVSRVMSLLRLSRRESWWKDAEILMLCHQLAVAERERPKARARLTWPDRAWLALLAGTVPGREAGRDAAARHSGHYLALASRHRPP